MRQGGRGPAGCPPRRGKGGLSEPYLSFDQYLFAILTFRSAEGKQHPIVYTYNVLIFLQESRVPFGITTQSPCVQITRYFESNNHRFKLAP